MRSSNVLYVVSKEEMENPSGPLAFPTTFAETVGKIYADADARREREQTTAALIEESLRLAQEEARANVLRSMAA